MKLGFDVDDVTFDFIPTLLDFYNSRYCGNLRFEDITSFRLWEVGIGKTKTEAINIIHDFYTSEFYNKMPFVSGAREGILKLCEDNVGCFVSARYSTVRKRTTRLLLQEFPQTQVFYSKSYIDNGKTKAEICRELGIELMVEDHFDTAIVCYEAGIRTLLFDKPWNQESNGKLERVHNWREILEKIKEEK